ncbi:MAG: exodeoxyribonuclease VII small subunit [Flavobacteriales bacterium]
MNYTEAYEELQQLVQHMESGQINVDELALKVKRASELIRICKVKLHETEVDVQKILKDLDATSNEDE